MEKNICYQRILTNAESAAFKYYFEKAYQGYIRGLKTSFNGLTEAKERLFYSLNLIKKVGNLQLS